MGIRFQGYCRLNYGLMQYMTITHYLVHPLSCIAVSREEEDTWDRKDCTTVYETLLAEVKNIYFIPWGWCIHTRTLACKKPCCYSKHADEANKDRDTYREYSSRLEEFSTHYA